MVGFGLGAVDTNRKGEWEMKRQEATTMTTMTRFLLFHRHSRISGLCPFRPTPRTPLHWCRATPFCPLDRLLGSPCWPPPWVSLSRMLPFRRALSAAMAAVNGASRGVGNVAGVAGMQPSLCGECGRERARVCDNSNAATSARPPPVSPHPHPSDVVIAGAVRTPFGAFLGDLYSVPAPLLGAAAIRGALAASGLTPADVDACYLGNVLGAGLGQVRETRKSVVCLSVCVCRE